MLLITGGRLARAADGLQEQHPWLAFPVAVAKKFSDDRAGNLAALVAYYAFVSIFPLLLVLVTVLEILFRGDPSLRHRLLTSALGSFPVIGTELRGTAHPLHETGMALVIALAVALAGGSRVASAAQNALNSAWLVPFTDRPRLPWSLVRNLAFVAVVGLGEIATSLLSGAAARPLHGLAAKLGAVLVALGLNMLLFWAGFRLATSPVVTTRELRAGAIVAAIAWQGLEFSGGFLVTHTVAKSSSAYGTFGLALGLLAWLYLQAQITMVAIEIDVVRSRKLWPRSMDPPPLTSADVTAYQLYAEAEQRRRGITIEVGMPGGAEGTDNDMNIEEALEKLIEHAQQELHVRRHRDHEKANRADHGHDMSELLTSAGQVDRYAREVLRLHETQLPERSRGQ